ncbi:hypothetical protein SAMN06265182_1816 [Persephonella hydrogeniphila]|uniref:Uncharacterized protein n=1 Tax=Persephonella hydrogeniphila TaxID=198703 RepID=A0A285NLE1_9AQUI|nr:hypothetical protein [Persephonella hydrogeniphila]SNZ10312.1 hypothetical protein SAMN06265182_1816 [Persephonella hydrogeniphila]
MRKMIVSIVVATIYTITPPLYPESICKEIQEITVKCFKDRESGKIKNCENGYKGDSPILKKACEMGCLSESLYEANTTADILCSEYKD